MNVVICSQAASAKGHAVFQEVGIGAAADGQTPPLLPCRLLIASKQGLDKGGIVAQRLVPLKEGDTLKTSYDALDKAAQEQFQQAFQYYKSWPQMKKRPLGTGSYHSVRDGELFHRIIDTYDMSVEKFRKLVSEQK